MKISRMVPAAFAAALLCYSWGCGGGGGGSDSSGQNALVEGRSAMNALAAEQTPANAQTLQQALDLFLQALQQDPNSSEAHFGAAVCLAGKLAEEVDGAATETPLPPAPPAPPGKPGEGSGGGGSVSPPSPPSPPNGGPPSPPAPPMGKAAVAVGAPVNGEVPPVPPGTREPAPIPRHRTLGLLWNLDNNLANPYVLLHMLAPISDLRLGFAPYFGYPHDNAARRQQILDGLNTVADHLAKVEADPNFAVTIPDVDSGGKAVTVGLPEVYMLDAYVQSLRAKVALSLAYVRDSGNGWIPPTAPVDGPLTTTDVVSNSTGSGSGGSGSAGGGTLIQPAPISLDKNSDGKLTPDEYLPPSPYLTLRDAKLLQSAQQAMQAVVDRENKGIDGVLARPATGSFLIPNVAPVQTVLTQIRDKVLPLIQQAATGPFTIDVPRWNIMPLVPEMQGGPTPMAPARGDAVFASPGGSGGSAGYMPQPITLKVNLAAWFASPPTDLKAFAPTFTLGSGGWPDPAKTAYPDKTFGGLFPDGITVDLPF